MFIMLSGTLDLWIAYMGEAPYGEIATGEAPQRMSSSTNRSNISGLSHAAPLQARISTSNNECIYLDGREEQEVVHVGPSGRLGATVPDSGQLST